MGAGAGGSVNALFVLGLQQRFIQLTHWKAIHKSKNYSPNKKKSKIEDLRWKVCESLAKDLNPT